VFSLPKSQNQKLKVLYLMRILLTKTDENHPITVAEMIRQLEEYGVSAERKSIYDDLEALRTFGFDVVQTKTRTTGYFIGARDFELPELKLLVDSVQSSKFITQKKTLSLIRKIESLASAWDAQLLQRQVYVRGRVKSMNESVYYNVDELSGAITQDRRIRFRYYEYSLSKERHYRRGGAFYEASPFALMWDDENYYMLAWDAAAGIMKHFRVDKMAEISLTEAAREGKDVFAGMDMSSYSRMVFGMFTGEEQTVQLRFANHLVGAVIDRFGRDVSVVPDGPEHFTVNVDVIVSPQFYAWLFAFGADAEILLPDHVRAGMRAQLCRAAELYGNAPSR
jgi:predicted DNA-binding transcriptional regulator YafY